MSDEQGRRHRGAVLYDDAPPREPVAPPDSFRIVLLRAPIAIRRVPDAMALCIPALARGGASVDAPGALRAADLRRGVLPEPLHARYEAGHVLHPAGELAGNIVFPHGRPANFEALALLLIDQRESEALAPYLALIRRELKLGAGVNALLGLRARLSPPRREDAPPARAPATRRLTQALGALDRHDAPDVTVDQFAEDLRFLALFESDDHALQRGALERLLRDVQGAAPPPRRARAKVVPLHRDERGE